MWYRFGEGLTCQEYKGRLALVLWTGRTGEPREPGWWGRVIVQGVWGQAREVPSTPLLTPGGW